MFRENVIEIDFSSALNDIAADASEWLNKDDFLKIEKIQTDEIYVPNDVSIGKKKNGLFLR